MDFTLFYSLSWQEAILRVLLALLFGFLLGYDRNNKNKPVDYRVYMIVATTTCLLAIMGQELTVMYDSDAQNIEMGIFRIVQGVLTGIGFLGAGAIIKMQDVDKVDEDIVGTATGASVWGAGSMGLMAGFGLYCLAILGFSLLTIILVVFGYLKKPLFDQTDINGEC